MRLAFLRVVWGCAVALSVAPILHASALDEAYMRYAYVSGMRPFRSTELTSDKQPIFKDLPCLWNFESSDPTLNVSSNSRVRVVFSGTQPETFWKTGVLEELVFPYAFTNVAVGLERSVTCTVWEKGNLSPARPNAVGQFSLILTGPIVADVVYSPSNTTGVSVNISENAIAGIIYACIPSTNSRSGIYTVEMRADEIGGTGSLAVESPVTVMSPTSGNPTNNFASVSLSNLDGPYDALIEANVFSIEDIESHTVETGFPTSVGRMLQVRVTNVAPRLFLTYKEPSTTGEVQVVSFPATNVVEWKAIDVAADMGSLNMVIVKTIGEEMSVEEFSGATEGAIKTVVDKASTLKIGFQCTDKDGGVVTNSIEYVYSLL